MNKKSLILRANVQDTKVLKQANNVITCQPSTRQLSLKRLYILLKKPKKFDLD